MRIELPYPAFGPAPTTTPSCPYFLAMLLCNWHRRLASALLLETWNVGLVGMNFRALLTGAPLSDVTLLPR